MTTKYTPTFAKDLDTYIVPNQLLISESVDGAQTAGATAGLTDGYGLVATGDTVEVSEHGYAGPFVIATVGNITAWIIGGPTLDGLLDARHPAVENLQPAPVAPVTEDEDAGTNIVATLLPLVAEAMSDVFAAPTSEPTPEPTFGGGGGFDGAGAGGTI